MLNFPSGSCASKAGLISVSHFNSITVCMFLNGMSVGMSISMSVSMSQETYTHSYHSDTYTKLYSSNKV